jgi:hypothetical protein
MVQLDETGRSHVIAPGIEVEEAGVAIVAEALFVVSSRVRREQNTALNVVARWAALGAFLGLCMDYLILGRARQERLIDCLAKWYERYKGLRWHTLGHEEALFAVRAMDRLFGAHLFSVQRLIVTVAATLVFGSIIIGLDMLDHVGTLQWHILFSSTILICFIFTTIFLFAMSFSITRLIAKTIIRIPTNVPYISMVGWIVLLCVQYVLLYYWGFVSFLIFTTMYFYLPILESASMPIGGIISFLAWHIIMITIPSIHNDVIASNGMHILPGWQLRRILLLFTADQTDIDPLPFILHLGMLLNLLPNFTRLLLAGIFIASFILRPIQRPIMVFWARIIENGKEKVFTTLLTLLFGGGALLYAIVASIL